MVDPGEAGLAQGTGRGLLEQCGVTLKDKQELVKQGQAWKAGVMSQTQA
jgi:hypothetical protein